MRHHGNDPNFEPMKAKPSERDPKIAHLVAERKRRLKRAHKRAQREATERD